MKRISPQRSIRITLPVTRLGGGPAIQVLRSLLSPCTPVDFNCFLQDEEAHGAELPDVNRFATAPRLFP